MIIIAHRGLLYGPSMGTENHPLQIDRALDAGFDAEIDLRVKTNTRKPTLWLGHDEPQYKIDMDWLKLRYNRLWVHCKNIEALEYVYGSFLNYFWHENDTVTITSNGTLWAYPGKQPIRNSIAVMPELHKDDITLAKGVCTDYPFDYRKGT